MDEKSRIGVVGVGWVGLVTATCFAEVGHEVIARDIVPEKVESLARGELTIHEPRLGELLTKNSERLRFTTSMDELLDECRLLFVCVDTPPTASGDADLSRVRSVLELLPAESDHVLVMKSTVPAGTGQAIRRDRPGLAYVSCPEFLKEGTAVEDFLNPDRVVIGNDPGFDAAGDAVAALYKPLGGEIVRTDVASAEMIKLGSNAFLATKISFINEIANVCEEVGADVTEVARGMGLDERIGSAFLRAGIGYGGSCFVGDETVLVRHGGTPRLVTFEGLWELAGGDAVAVAGTTIQPEDLWAWSWVPGERTPEWMPVTVLTKRDYDGEFVEVQTKMGRRVTVTADHPFVVGDGQDDEILTRVLARELTEADWLPLAAGTGSEFSPALQPLAGVFGESIPHRDALVGHACRDVTASSGVAVGDPGLPDETPAESVFASENWCEIGRTIGRAGAVDEGQRLPDGIWELDSGRKRALLSGLWEGDGSWSLINGGPSVVIEFGTISDELADGVARLLADQGIICSWRRGRTAKSTKITHWLRVSGADQVEAASFLIPERDLPQVEAALAKQAKRTAPAGYRRFAEGGLPWARVTNVVRTHAKRAVYSLEVPGSHTVVTSGGLIASNCFPKDVTALKQLAGNSGYHFQLLTAVIEVNELQKRRVIGKLVKHLGSLAGRRIALLGLAFKPNTDDMRQASSIVLAARLQGEGATVVAYDPVAMDAAGGEMAGVEMAPSAIDAISGADAVVLVTEWDEFAGIDWNEAAAKVANRLVVDGRNYLDPAEVSGAGFAYEGIGRLGDPADAPTPAVTGAAQGAEAGSAPAPEPERGGGG